VLGQDPVKMAGVPPATGVVFHTPLAGLLEVRMPAALAITQSVVDGHDTPPNSYGQDPLLQPGTTCVELQAPGPPVGSVELITSP
jgi:hypothetical protein